MRPEGRGEEWTRNQGVRNECKHITIKDRSHDRKRVYQNYNGVEKLCSESDRVLEAKS
jgi:hypothetical protein